MTNPIDKAAQPEALRLADSLEGNAKAPWTRDEVANELRRLHAALAAAEARNATQAAQIEACRADAADAKRYRWLRDRANNVAVRAPLVLMVDQSFANIQWHDTRHGAGLDAELDAVMAKDRAAASIGAKGGRRACSVTM